MVSKNLSFTKDQLDFSTLVFGYTYKAAKRVILDNWVDRRVGGFRLNWFIQETK